MSVSDLVRRKTGAAIRFLGPWLRESFLGRWLRESFIMVSMPLIIILAFFAAIAYGAIRILPVILLFFGVYALFLFLR